MTEPVAYSGLSKEELDIIADDSNFYFDVGDKVVVPGLVDLDGVPVLNLIIHERITNGQGQNLYLTWSSDYPNMYYGWFLENQIQEG